MAARRQVDTSQYSDGNGDKLSLTHYPAQRGRILAAVSPPRVTQRSLTTYRIEAWIWVSGVRTVTSGLRRGKDSSIVNGLEGSSVHV